MIQFFLLQFTLSVKENLTVIILKREKLAVMILQNNKKKKKKTKIKNFQSKDINESGTEK